MEIHEAVKFIEKLVNYDYNFNKEDFHEFDIENLDRIAAIDGSSIKILDGGNFSVFLIRVGYVIVNKNEIKKHISKISVEIVEEDKKIDEIREKMEIGLINKINVDMILIDGALKYNENVVGISKKSSYKLGTAPLLFLIKKAGEKYMPNKRWYYEIEKDTYAVKFHPYSKFAFRVDAIGNVKEKFSKISSFCNEISCIGYPYPLAIAHRMVEIKKEDADYIKSIIQANSKIGIDEWENIFYDYHEYMEV